MSGTSSNAATAAVQREHSHAGGSARGQPVLVVSSRLVEVLQPEELQMMFLTTLSTALAPGMLRATWQAQARLALKPDSM